MVGLKSKLRRRWKRAESGDPSQPPREKDTKGLVSHTAMHRLIDMD